MICAVGSSPAPEPNHPCPPARLKPVTQAQRCVVSLLAALAALCAVRATEFGVMWHWPTAHHQNASLTRRLETNGIEWIRAGAGGEAKGFKTGVFWWPAAVPQGSTPSGPAMRLADDLWTVYWQGRTNAPTSSSGPTAFEIGNEPDLYFTRDLPDRMAATLKAAWWGLKRDDPERTVLMPSLATAPGPYAEQLADNGLGSFTDGWNLHFYGWAQDFAGNIAAHRRSLAKIGRPTLPLWVTEFGFADFPAGNAADEIQLARQRTFFERVAFEGAALGIARQWAFILTPLTEAGLDFGLLDRDFAPRPALQGLLASTQLLREAEPRYRLVTRAGGDGAGYVFRLRASGDKPARYATILFSPSRRADFSLPARNDEPPAAQPPSAPASSLFPLQVRFPADLRPVQLGLGAEQQEWSGTELTVTVSATNNLVLVTPERRFTIAGCDWVPLCKPGTVARLPFHPSVERSFPRPVAQGPSPVIATLRPLGSDLTADKGTLAYRYPTEVPLRFELRWHNFSDRDQSGSWKLHLPAGWQLEPKSVATGKLSIPSRTDFATVVVLRPSSGISPARRDPIALEWRGDRGETDQSVIRMAATGPACGPAEPFVPDWQSLNAPSIQWATQKEGSKSRLALTRLASGVSPGLILPLHGLKRLAIDDVFRLQIRLANPTPPAAPVSLRCEFISPQREVFRYGEDQTLSPEWQIFEWRVGDLTPAFWSHVGAGDPRASRYLRLGLFGFTEGQTLEMGPLELIRSPSAASQSRPLGK